MIQHMIVNDNHLTQSQDRVDVAIVLLDLLPESHRLIVLSRIYIFRPASLEVVHALAEVLGPEGVDVVDRTFSRNLDAPMDRVLVNVL